MKFFEKLDHPHVVYRMYDAADELLYVGCSMGIVGRLNNHSTMRPWIDEVTTIKVTRYPGYIEARTAEETAISNEHPRYNVATVAIDRIGSKAIREIFPKRPRRSPGTASTCPKCGQPKENLKPGTAYCRACMSAYQREHRLKKLAKTQTGP